MPSGKNPSLIDNFPCELSLHLKWMFRLYTSISSGFSHVFPYFPMNCSLKPPFSNEFSQWNLHFQWIFPCFFPYFPVSFPAGGAFRTAFSAYRRLAVAAQAFHLLLQSFHLLGQFHHPALEPMFLCCFDVGRWKHMVKYMVKYVYYIYIWK